MSLQEPFLKALVFCSFKLIFIKYLQGGSLSYFRRFSICLPSWKHYPHFPLGDGEQLTPPPTSVSSRNSSQSNKHIPSQWPQWLVQGHDAKHENQSQGSERAFNKKALSFPLSGQSSHICLRLLTQPAQSLPDNKANQEENGGHRWSLTVKKKRGSLSACDLFSVEGVQTQGEAKYILLPRNKCNFCLNLSLHLVTKQWIWDSMSVSMSINSWPVLLSLSQRATA